MAQFSTNFSGYTTGDAPSDWTSRWNAISATVEEVAETEGGKVLRFVAATDTRRALSWDAVGSASDVETLTKFRILDASVVRTVWPARIRGGGEAGSESSYDAYFSTGGSGGGHRLHKYVSGASTNLTSNLPPDLNTDWRWLRLRVNGTSLQYRTWLDGEAEPGSWDGDASDPSLTTGWVGIGQFSEGTVEFDVFTVGTDGDTAPPIGTATFTLNTSVIGNGSIALDPPGGTYDDGTVVQATATPAAGWSFESWSGDLSGSTNPQNVTMDANKSITATFADDSLPQRKKLVMQRRVGGLWRP